MERIDIQSMKYRGARIMGNKTIKIPIGKRYFQKLLGTTFSAANTRPESGVTKTTSQLIISAMITLDRVGKSKRDKQKAHRISTYHFT